MLRGLRITAVAAALSLAAQWFVTIVIATSSQPVDRATIGTVAPGSPARAAGLAPGDTVVRVGPHAVNSWLELMRALQSVNGQAPVPVEFERGGQRQTLEVTPHRSETTGRQVIGVTQATRPEPHPLTTLEFVRAYHALRAMQWAEVRRAVTRPAGSVVTPVAIVSGEQGPQARRADAAMMVALGAAPFVQLCAALALALAVFAWVRPRGWGLLAAGVVMILSQLVAAAYLAFGVIAGGGALSLGGAWVALGVIALAATAATVTLAARHRRAAAAAAG